MLPLYVCNAHCLLSYSRITKRLALDCEMVGVGIDGKESILARVSLVNSFGQVVYDQFVSPSEKVIDYRTAVSGIRPQDLKDGNQYFYLSLNVALKQNNKSLNQNY